MELVDCAQSQILTNASDAYHHRLYWVDLDWKMTHHHAHRHASPLDLDFVFSPHQLQYFSKSSRLFLDHQSLLLHCEHYHAQSAESIRFLAPLSNVCIIGAIEPLPTATLIPAVLVEDYSHEIAFGAASLLQQMADRPWTNYEMAQVNRAKFYDGIRDAYRFRIEQTESARVPNPVRKRNFF